MVDAFPLDYMHLCCLGVMRELLWAWLKGPLSCRISQRQKYLILHFLIHIANFIPSEFARKSRSLAELARWKATELRTFLLYTGPVVLFNILPTRLYNHFLIFHVAIKILVNEKLCTEFNQYANELLNLFVADARDIYGKQFLSYNVHNLIHLATDVLRFGHLDSFSAFPFENYLHQIKNLLRKHDKPLPQIIRRINEMQMNEMPVAISHMSPATVLSSKHIEGPIINQCDGIQFKMALYRSWAIRTYTNSDCFVILNDSKIVKVLNIMKTKDGIILIGQYFKRLTDSFTFPLQSSALGIVCAKQLSEIQQWPIAKIKSKAVCLPRNVDNLQEFNVYPLIMQKN